MLYFLAIAMSLLLTPLRADLLEGVDHQVIWVVQLADCIDSETAKISHLLFGKIDEF